MILAPEHLKALIGVHLCPVQKCRSRIEVIISHSLDTSLKRILRLRQKFVKARQSIHAKMRPVVVNAGHNSLRLFDKLVKLVLLTDKHGFFLHAMYG